MKARRARPKGVDDYIAGFPPEVRGLLRRLRSTIRRAVPAAEEVISYGIPAYRLHGRVMLYFAAWKEHYALYPSTAPLVAEFARELAPYEVSGKGTIRFPLSALPSKLIAAIARYRAAEVEAIAKAKAAARKKR